MPRLFVGLELPDVIKRELSVAQEGIPDARWQSHEQLHITLNFIGDVDEDRVVDIRSAVTGVPFEPLTVALRGVGHFGRRGRAKTLWIGVAPVAPLRELHRQIADQLSVIGIPVDKRSYTPHVTLARLRPGTDIPEAYLQEHANLATSSFAINHVSLFTSVQSPAGSRYEVIQRFLPVSLD